MITTAKYVDVFDSVLSISRINVIVNVNVKRFQCLVLKLLKSYGQIFSECLEVACLG